MQTAPRNTRERIAHEHFQPNWSQHINQRMMQNMVRIQRQHINLAFFGFVNSFHDIWRRAKHTRNNIAPQFIQQFIPPRHKLCDGRFRFFTFNCLARGQLEIFSRYKFIPQIIICSHLGNFTKKNNIYRFL